MAVLPLNALQKTNQKQNKMPRRIWTKICGITNEEDAAVAARAGVSALGFNFYPQSLRYISPQETRRIQDRLQIEFAQDCPEIAGVFVNSDLQTVIAQVAEANLNTVQLHGDETLEFIAELHQRLPQIRIIRALRPEPEFPRQTTELIRQLLHEISDIRILLDAFVPGEYGGTGKRIDPELFQTVANGLECPVILAGGLTPENVAEAVCSTSPAGVDTAGGVESSPGIKDHSRIRQFLIAARSAQQPEQAAGG